VDAESGITIYPKWYLYEYSSVIIPANPDAINLMLKDARSDGMKNILSREQEIMGLRNAIAKYSGELNEIRNELNELKAKMNGSVHSKTFSKEAFIEEALGSVIEEIVGRKRSN
jgi:hypothetical protein